MSSKREAAKEKMDLIVEKMNDLGDNFGDIAKVTKAFFFIQLNIYSIIELF